MINKIRRLMFGSITRELFWTIILCLIASYIFYTILWSLGGGTLLIDKLGNNANSIYIELDRHLWNLEDGKSYVNQLAQFYKMNIAITDDTGDILLKDDNTYVDFVNLEYVTKVMRGSYNSGDFYHSYDLEINNKNYKLIVWRSANNSFIARYNLMQYYFLFIVVCTMAVFAGSLYMLIRKKIRYIGYITNTINSISYGNLDNEIEIKGHDELSRMAGKINEMTHRLKITIEQERAAERFNKELITNVSHDLRTPLTSIIGYLELLRNKELTESKKKEFIEILNARADRLKYLIDDLFEFSKISSGGERLNLTSIDVIELLEQCIGEHDSAAVEKGISFRKSFSEPDLIISADPPKLARVFENILSNAVKYGKNGSVVEITVKCDESDVKISFKNISSIALSNNVKHIFDRFYRMDESRNSGIEGSGLGLAIASSIVELHKGEINADVKNNEFEIFVKITRDMPLLKAN